MACTHLGTDIKPKTPATLIENITEMQSLEKIALPASEWYETQIYQIALITDRNPHHKMLTFQTPKSIIQTFKIKH